MKQRTLGANGPKIGEIGLGCMSFAGAFGETDDETSFACMDAALASGINFWDTANIYGAGKSESVIGDYLASTKAKPVLATKVGIVRGGGFDNSADYIRSELEGSLKRLQSDRVDLYYIHRRQADLPIETVVETLASLIDEGLIGGYGLSEVAPSSLRRAHAVHPCAAVQSEYSLWSRLPELGMLQACAELDVTFVPFSPVARGFLTDASVSHELAQQDGFRAKIPRFSDENWRFNEPYWKEFKSFCEDHDWPMAAVCLAWLLDKGANVVPIPATRTAAHLAQWLPASNIVMTDRVRSEIDRILPPGWAHGDRYWDSQSLTIERYC